MFSNNETERSVYPSGSQSQDQNIKKVPQVLTHVESQIFSIPKFLVFFFDNKNYFFMIKFFF